MRVDDDSAIPPVDPPTYPGQSGEGAQVGELHSRVRRLEAAAPASTETLMWPMSYELLPRAIDGSAIDGAGGFFSATTDLTYWSGYYYDNGGDASIAYLYLRLGPQGSIWGINLAAERGPDCGILNFDLQTISENSTGHGYGLDGQGMIPGSTDRTVGTFYTTGSLGIVDLYNSVQTKNRVWPASYSQFRIYGSDGTALAANGIFSAADGYYRFLSGAGIYCLRMRVNGKHVDSSGYATRITSLRFTRYTSDGFPTG